MSEYVSVCERVDTYFLSPCCVLYIWYVSQTAGTPGSHGSAVMKLGGNVELKDACIADSIRCLVPTHSLIQYFTVICTSFLIV